MLNMVISRFGEISPCRPDCPNRTATCHRENECKIHTEWRIRKKAFEEGELNKRKGYQSAKDQRADQIYRQFKKDHLPGREKGWR